MKDKDQFFLWLTKDHHRAEGIWPPDQVDKRHLNYQIHEGTAIPYYAMGRSLRVHHADGPFDVFGHAPRLLDLAWGDRPWKTHPVSDLDVTTFDGKEYIKIPLHPLTASFGITYFRSNHGRVFDEFGPRKMRRVVDMMTAQFWADRLDEAAFWYMYQSIPSPEEEIYTFNRRCPLLTSSWIQSDLQLPTQAPHLNRVPAIGKVWKGTVWLREIDGHPPGFRPGIFCFDIDPGSTGWFETSLRAECRSLLWPGKEWW